MTARRWGILFDGLLILLLLAGLGMRFSWMDWHQGTSLHPDEYGLTNTLTQLRIPASLDEYFNTRLSPLSPYRKYDLQGNPTRDGPDNGMRWGQWPQILLRWAAEISGNTGYDELRVMGRKLSAVADSLTLVILYLTGKRLYGRRVGLLAAALGALAVMHIQQSHFMTVDNFATLCAVAAMYCAVRLAQTPGLVRRSSQPGKSQPDYQLNEKALAWSALFGVSLGFTLASRINLLPLGGMILPAAFLSIADLKLKSRRDLPRIAAGAALYLMLAGLAGALAFRVAQPMSFRASSGDTSLLTLQPNPDWLENMRISMQESRGIGGGPPQEQWAHRTPIVFPLANMVVWGMGLPLGLAAWAGFLWAAWKSFHDRERWRAHLIPLIWVGGFFVFMGTRWASSMRYFLPIYPFLCLLAAWFLLDLWGQRKLSRALPAALIVLVLAGTFSWAWAFVGAVYRKEHTRIQASRWIYAHAPAPFQLSLEGADGIQYEPVPAPDGLWISATDPFIQPFTPQASGKLAGITIPHAAVQVAGEQSVLQVTVARDPDGAAPVDDARLVASHPAGSPSGAQVSGSQVSGSQAIGSQAIGSQVSGQFRGMPLKQGQTYYLIVSLTSEAPVRVFRTVIANENWDEGLPLSIEGRDPFGSYYRGLTMQVRWYDDENKRQMFLDALAQVDIILLPSQRGIWSSCRLPRTFPMTIEYYRALFDGRLGFDLAAVFTTPLQLGPLAISDVGGSAAWGETPQLPVFNNRFFAVEEAFSVYDHPPVWVFKKRPDFNLQTAEELLGAIDLSQVVVQSPREADGPACPP